MSRFNEIYINNKSFGLVSGGFFSILAFLTMVMPNSFQVTTALMMIVCTLVSFFYISVSDISVKFLAFLMLNVVVTLIYLLVGVINSAPEEAVKQVVIIYIITPILWFIILTALISNMDDRKIIRAFVFIAWLCCFSVFIFFYLFENFGATAVSLFIENPNLNTSNGYSGATMHVYGPLIFMVGGFFAAPEVIKSKVLMFSTLMILSLTAITSGRTALTISILLGLFVFLFFSSSRVISSKSKFYFLVFILLATVSVIYSASKFRGIDISYLMDTIVEKLSSGGGNERANQTQELIRSAFDSYGLGRGHGIGIDYIRSEEFPWRYETLWWATLHRVGLLGSMIYVSSFIFYIISTLVISINRGLSSFEKFLFGGFICVFIASNTNPYLEAIPFQWMYILPILSLLIRSKKNKVYQ